jgi:hypothetical protein
MTPKQQPGEYSPKEAQQRRDKALHAALSMPAIPHAESSRKKKAAPKRRSPKKPSK